MSQRDLKNLLLDYLSSREDVEITSLDGRVFELTANSNKAQEEFNARPRLEFTFEAAIKQYDDSCEYVSTSHPFLEIVRNDLERMESGDVRLCEVYVPCNIQDSSGECEPPGFRILNAEPDKRASVDYKPFVLFTYRIVVDSDVPLDQFFPVVVSQDGKLVSGLAERIFDKQMPLCDGRPDGVQGIDLGELLVEANRHANKILSKEKKLIEFDVNKNYSSEKSILDADLLRKLADQRNEVERADLKKQHQNRLEDLLRKLRSDVVANLESALILWLPRVQYSFGFQSSKLGQFKTTVGKHDSLDDRLTQTSCKSCNNVSAFCICKSGQHLVCAGECESEIRLCKVCNDDFCPSHGTSCDDCSDSVCEHDSIPCQYSIEHDESARYCPTCLTESFEASKICKSCAETCEHCERQFPNLLVKKCRSCSKVTCYGHESESDGQICEECDELACVNDGIETEDGSWACKDHASQSTCCSKYFGDSKLKQCCVSATEKLCPSHNVTCQSCKEPVCENPDHRKPLRKHQNAIVCKNCRKACGCCPDTDSHSYLSQDLCGCAICSKGICEEHQLQCETCCTSQHLPYSQVRTADLRGLRKIQLSKKWLLAIRHYMRCLPREVLSSLF